MDKECVVLFIIDKPSMIANALIDRMEEAGIPSIQEKADITSVSQIDPLPQIILMFLQDVERPLDQFFSYMRERTEETGAGFYLIGTPEELDEAVENYGGTYIRSMFTRPLSGKTLVDAVQKEIDRVREAERKKRILVVDDDAAMLRGIKHVLETDYEVFISGSAFSALQLLVKQSVDLILLDYEMPVATGDDLLRMLRSETHTTGIPVMFLTSRNDRETIERLLDLKPEGYLLKTMSQAEILNNIRIFFEKHPCV